MMSKIRAIIKLWHACKNLKGRYDSIAELREALREQRIKKLEFYRKEWELGQK